MSYKITIVYNDGIRKSFKEDFVNAYGLMTALEKCEIKSFKVELV